MQMNHTLAIAKTFFPMEGWEDRLFRSNFRLARRIARSPARWPAKSVSWNPLTNWESNLFVNLTRNVAVHQHVGTTGGMLHAKFLRGSPLKNFM